MPCTAKPRGFTSTTWPWDDKVQNNPCGLPAVTSVGGVSVSDSLCLFHYEQKYGQSAVAGQAITDDSQVQPGYDGGQAGIYVPANGPYCSTGATQFLASRIYLGRFVAPRNIRVVSAKMITTVAASADDPCDVGIYSAASNTATLLGSAGSTSGKMNAVAGIQTIPFSAPIQLVAGTPYFAAFAYGPLGGTAATHVQSSCQRFNVAGLFLGNGYWYGESLSQAPVFPCPASITLNTYAPANYFPVMALVEG